MISDYSYTFFFLSLFLREIWDDTLVLGLDGLRNLRLLRAISAKGFHCSPIASNLVSDSRYNPAASVQ